MAFSIVQSASNNGSGTTHVVTLGAPPTTGNLIVALVGQLFSPFNRNSTSWGSILTNESGSYSFAMLYRYVQPGDTAALPDLFTNNFKYWYATAYEISGVTGVIGTDLLQSVSGDHITTSPVTPSLTPMGSGNILLAGMFNASAGGAGANTLDASDFTQDVYAALSGTQMFYSAHIAPSVGATPVGFQASSTYSTKAFYYGLIEIGGNPDVNVSLTGVSGTGAARTVGIQADNAFSLTGIAAAGTPGAVGPTRNANVPAPQASATGIARQVANLAGAFLQHVEATGVAGQMVYKNVPLVGAKAYAAALPIGTEIAPPIVYFPVFSIMRDTPVAASGAMSDDPVLGVGSLFPSGSIPVSAIFTLPQASAQGHAATLTPYFNVTAQLAAASAVGRAGPVLGVGNV